MRPMRPYKPAPKNASANRIRERYLHQLGLQRGTGPPAAAPHPSNQQVVVISGLPSLPEDRATTEHVMESHDFSISKHSQHTAATPASADADSSSQNDDEDASDSGSAQEGFPEAAVAPPGDASHCSKSTLSVSPNGVAGETLTAMALACPNSLRVAPHHHQPMKPEEVPPSINNNALPFPLPNSGVHWRGASLSKPATVLLDSARMGNDHDSVSSVETSTTAESSLTAAMVSMDWGAAHPGTAAGMSSSCKGGESPASAPGVYFQCGHPHLLGSHVQVAPGGAGCASSSLAHALNKFNIDSDTEASVASNSVVDEHMDEDDASVDDASVASHASAGSARSHRSSTSHGRGMRPGGRKIGKKMLMDRAVAHERILQIQRDESQKRRASLVHSQRMNYHVSASGLTTALAQEAPRQLAGSPSSASSSQASTQLLHVRHGSAGSRASVCRMPGSAGGSPGGAGGDLGRTPTASNCGPRDRRPYALPAGVHLAVPPLGASPLRHCPRLASRMPAPPPPGAGMIHSSHGAGCSSEEAQVETREDSSSRQRAERGQQATVDDVMEVAMTLSKLGGKRMKSPVPRIR